jgi:hypothetical protein
MSLLSSLAQLLQEGLRGERAAWKERCPSPLVRTACPSEDSVDDSMASVPTTEEDCVGEVQLSASGSEEEEELAALAEWVGADAEEDISGRSNCKFLLGHADGADSDELPYFVGSPNCCSLSSSLPLCRGIKSLRNYKRIKLFGDSSNADIQQSGTQYFASANLTFDANAGIAPNVPSLNIRKRDYFGHLRSKTESAFTVPTSESEFPDTVEDFDSEIDDLKNFVRGNDIMHDGRSNSRFLFANAKESLALFTPIAFDL